MNVIHRTTLQFLTSVNEPDYPEPTWKWDPDMTAVVGVPTIYWKAPADWNLPGAGPVEMTQAEKDTVDANLAAALLVAKAADFQNRIPRGIIYPALKTADETRVSNANLADDATLKFPIEAGAHYLFFFRVFFDTTPTADFKCSLNGPLNPVGVRFRRHAIAPGAVALSGIGVSTAFGAVLPVTSAVGPGGYVEGFGGVRNGPNAGTVAFQWGQNTADPGNTTVLAGSVLEYARIA